MVRTRSHEKQNNRPGWRHSMLAAFLSVFLVCALPVPAHANVVTSISDVAALVAHWASDHASYLIKAAKWLYSKTETAIQIAVPIVTKYLTSALEIGTSQAEADSEERVKLMQAAGKTASESLTPTQSRICSLTHAAQEAAVANEITNQATDKLAQISAGRGAGINVDTSSPAYAAAEVNELCKLGFIDTSVTGRYGALPSNMGCTDIVLNPPAPNTASPANARFIDADVKLSSLIGKLQYPIPVKNHVTVNPRTGRVSFVGVTMTETAPGLGSEMDYAAAYKFCEHLQPELASPTHNEGTPGPGDIASMDSYAKGSALRSAASEECFRALAYRTSCRAAAATSLEAVVGGQTASCHEAQTQLCARLTDTHQNGGLELTMQGDDPLYAAALTACKDNGEGISQAMYEAILARQCHDRNYVLRVLPAIVTTGEELEHIRAFECPAQEAAHKDKMNDEKMRLLVSIKNLLIMRTE